MQFTRLRLNGFKSFVDPTDLVIQAGLTGVVGPNGCGKSNLLEALRWVMGENRPTAMRGGGMEDVIFAGTATRASRNFAEVSLSIDNADRLAPAQFNDADVVEIVRRITRDAGSAYRVQGKDVRARDVQMLFADAATGATSPALVRQGQISELIHAKPKNRRRILEDAAGIAGLYQRRHEAELKLKGAEANLARLDDTVDQLAQQLNSLARQAKQAARYREIGEQLRRAEGLLLYRRWREASEAMDRARALLQERSGAAAAAEAAAEAATEAREAADAAMPALREEDAVGRALVQKLEVEAASHADQARQADEMIQRLSGRLRQIQKDIDRETALNADADDSVARLEDERVELIDAGEDHEADLEGATEAAEEAARVLGEREGALATLTEDVARLAARHQSAERLVADCRKGLARAEAAAEHARAAVHQAETARREAVDRVAEAEAQQDDATDRAANADAALQDAEAARTIVQSEEADARAARAAVESERQALRAEHQALSRLVARDAGQGDTVMDLVRVDSGYEAALGAALADDLRAPLTEDGTGWTRLPDYDRAAPLPEGAEPLSTHVTAPSELGRRIAQVGLVTAGQGAAMQAALQPGQRFVSREGHLWRWDGFRARPEDAPGQAALRLQQKNRLAVLDDELAELDARAEAAAEAHAALEARLAALTTADRDAREARRTADARVAELARSLSRAAADRDLAEGRLQSARDAVARHETEAQSARQSLAEAEKGMEGLADLGSLRRRVDDMKMAVEAARMTTMAKRAAHDELKREGEARAKRLAAIDRELISWRGRLDNAGGRLGDLTARRERTERELAEAERAPRAISEAQARTGRALAEATARAEAAAAALREGEARQSDAAATERQ
ncbi:chromosome segregation SMC family protein, partial [Palleronia sp.]|uniref:chromosome segregation SMC family protein n=1 Tax=Palleronia sp. TaxID=1940284 RepID=UPI0035C81597